MRGTFVPLVLGVLCGGALTLSVAAQSPASTRLAILQAEDRRAATAHDLAIIRAGLHSADPQTARIAVRALGRLERPSLIPDLLPPLRHAAPEVRAEAANAVGQAAQGSKYGGSGPALEIVQSALTARLRVEADSDVRQALCESIGRLPYASASQVDTAERAIVAAAQGNTRPADRLGVAYGLYRLVQLQRSLRPPGEAAFDALRDLMTPRSNEATSAARVRRLAAEALFLAAPSDAAAMTAAARDPDAQVRRLAIRAAASAESFPGAAEVLAGAARDDSPIVRLEAVRGLARLHTAAACADVLAETKDPAMPVVLTAIDGLAACGASEDAVAELARLAAAIPAAPSPRDWHRAAHALVSLSGAAPDRAYGPLGALLDSTIWQLRLYAARAAALLPDRGALERLARDADDNVREAAVDGLRKTAGHDADAVYVAQLSRSGYQVLRAAALALVGTTHPDAAAPALGTAMQRLVSQGRDNSHDARDAIARALAGIGGAARTAAAAKTPSRAAAAAPELAADGLRRLAAPRARVTVHDVGTFELALFTAQAPATVLRFARLAESGYYNGLTFHRVVPNFVIQGGSPGANEYIGDATFMRDEVGTWPHVRGAVGISTRGRDTGDAQIFVDLVDNPRLDHDYTVFAQVLNGIDVVDQILEGDVIERVEIVAQ